MYTTSYNYTSSSPKVTSNFLPFTMSLPTFPSIKTRLNAPLSLHFWRWLLIDFNKTRTSSYEFLYFFFTLTLISGRLGHFTQVTTWANLKTTVILTTVSMSVSSDRAIEGESPDNNKLHVHIKHSNKLIKLNNKVIFRSKSLTLLLPLWRWIGVFENYLVVENL